VSNAGEIDGYEQLRERAIAIGEEIWSQRRQTPAGGLAWIGPVGYGTERIPLRLRQLGPDLYGGTTGIALFFAALDSLGAGGRERALETLAPLRRKLADLIAAPERASRLNIPVGGLVGIGSYIYGLLKVGELLNEPSLILEAHSATTLLTAERIARDQRVRIQTGSAGTILALLALNRKISEPNAVGCSPLTLACLCAEHLIDARVSLDCRPRAWALSKGKPALPGFAYGAAGISYSLLRLYELSGREDFFAAALEGNSFVRSWYSESWGRWLDAREDFAIRYRPRVGTWRDWWTSGTLDELEGPGPSDGPDGSVPVKFLNDYWCHGSSGIVLGRVCAPCFDGHSGGWTDVTRTLERLSDRAYSHDLSYLAADDLCCGHMGNVEVLLSAALSLGQRRWYDVARRLMANVQERALEGAEDGGFCYRLSAARGTGHFAPSLFQGIAGVGYMLLRLAAPLRVPCVLTLD
jgi:lantibiotic modifying enzyme